MVGAGTASTNNPSDAAIVIAKPTNKGLALTTDCNSRYVFADPYKGAMIAVAEAARNIVCSGGQPLGVTNCLNFGNPYNPEVYYQFVNAIKGMGEACIKFDTPVTGGNVSFYNQSPDGPVYPTPTIGMVGLLDNVDAKMTMDFKKAGDQIYLIGQSRNDINSSEYLHKIHSVEFSPAPYFDLDEEFTLQRTIENLINSKLIVSAHDVSEGGVFVTLTESGFNRNLGYSITTNQSIRKDAFLFGEAQSRVIVSVDQVSVAAFEASLTAANATFENLGTVTEGVIFIDDDNWNTIADWKNKYDHAIGNYLAGHESEQALIAL
jgi:phosphoribosylformylglycinamidine synthase